MYYTYILASKRNGTLYVGVTGDLYEKVQQHKRGLIPGFTKKYKINRLVYYESFTDVDDALDRERRLKKWNRAWKIRLIEKDNPQWQDLSNDLPQDHLAP